MAEERITETRDEAGNTHTTHTIVSDGAEPRRSGGAGWVIALVLIVLAIGAFFLFSQQNNSEIAANEAMTEAANNVGDAAGQVGDAAQNAGEAVQDAVDGE